MRIRNGDAALVIGSRSALFAPCRNLGLVIIDEEHEWTYKNEQTPRYHAREAAEALCAQLGPSPDLVLAFFTREHLDHVARFEAHEVVRAAREVRDRLAAAGLESWPRLSGGKGIHVCVPLQPGASWDRAKDFAEGIARSLAEDRPDRYVASASKELRRGRIFIDWLRNGRGNTSVSGWVLRARPGAPVAMPLRWDELGRTRSGAHWNIRSARRRAASLRSDPWEGFFQVRQRLPR